MPTRVVSLFGKQLGSFFCDLTKNRFYNSTRLRSLLVYVVLCSTKTKNSKYKNEEFKQCLQNDRVSFGAKRTAMPLQ